MDTWGSRRRCVYLEGPQTRKGFILDDYEEAGGPNDGQHYAVVEDSETKKLKHVKIEDIQETAS